MYLCYPSHILGISVAPVGVEKVEGDYSQCEVEQDDDNEDTEGAVDNDDHDYL